MSDEVVEVLKDIQRWVQIIGIQEAREVMEDGLSDDDEVVQNDLRIAYHLTNGDNSTRDIATHVSGGRDWVSSRQRQWAKMGLVEQEHSRAPYEHIITLEEAGMDIPEVPTDEEENDD